MATQYNPLDDVIDPNPSVAAGAASAPASSASQGYNPLNDVIDPNSGAGHTLVQPPADKQQSTPPLLGTSWRSIVGDLTPHMPGSSGPQPVVNQPIDSHIGAGFVRGVRDFWDKTIENPNPEYGYTPSDADLAQTKQQNTDDRTQFERQYGNDTSAYAGRIFGNVVGTAPLLGPAGDLVAAGIRGIPFIAPAARGLEGILSRAAERVIQGGAGGGVQSAATSDPSQPLAPQVGSGVATGAGLSFGLGALGDTLSNAIRRLRGDVVRTVPDPNPPPTAVPGTSPPIVPDDVVERARQATLLQREGVPFQASQISNDPVLQFTNKYGSQAPFSGAGNFINEQQLPRFRNAALQRAEPGTPASLVTPQFVTNNDSDIDNLYWGSVHTIPSVPSVGPSGNTIATDFAPIRARIPSTLDPTDQGRIHNAMNTIQNTFGPGSNANITGSDAANLTKRTNSVLSPLLDSDDSTVRNFGSQIRDQVTQRLRGQMTQPQQDMFDQANSRFRALRTLQDVAGSNGSFTPGELYKGAQDTAKTFNSPGSLDEFSRAANTVIQPTLDGRGALGKVTGSGVPIGAGIAAGSVLKPLADWLTTGGTGTATVMGTLVANRLLQGANRAGGIRAMNAAVGTTGTPVGGASVADLQNALDLLRRPAVAAQQQQQQSQ